MQEKRPGTWSWVWAPALIEPVRLTRYDERWSRNICIIAFLTLTRLALVFRLGRTGRELTLQDGRPDDPYSSLQKSKILFRRPSWGILASLVTCFGPGRTGTRSAFPSRAAVLSHATSRRPYWGNLVRLVGKKRGPEHT